MAEVATISVDTNQDGIPEELVTTTAAGGQDDLGTSDEGGSEPWEPMLSELKGVVTDLLTEVRVMNQNSLASSTLTQELLQVNRDLTAQIQTGQSQMLAMLTPPPPPEPPTIIVENPPPSGDLPVENPVKDVPKEPEKEPEEKPRARRRGI